MTELQEKLLEMLKWFTEYLDANNFTYYAGYGTVLGALRHQGFIPWDDDIDILLPRSEYNRLIDEFVNNEKFKLESLKDGNRDFLYTYAKLYDTKTTLIERQKNNIKRGIYIDVFPLDGVPDFGVEKKSKYAKFVYKYNHLLMTRMCAIRKQRKWYKNAAIFLSRAIPNFIINDKKLASKIDVIASKYSFETCEYVTNYTSTYEYRDIVKKETFGNPSVFLFEGIRLKCPEKAEEYLVHLYGDWQKLPPIEKRGIQHDYVYIDLNFGYEENL